MYEVMYFNDKNEYSMIYLKKGAEGMVKHRNMFSVIHGI